MKPRLIQVLQEAVALGREGRAREGNAHFFALFLLTEFRAKEALPVVLEILSLRDPILEELLGCAITETVPRTLAVLAGDQLDLIESLISNRHLDDYVRWGAATAFCYLVGDGQVSRDDAIERLARQLRHAMSLQDGWGTTIVVSELGDLNPLEVLDLIKEAFDQHLVDESMIDWSCFEDFLLHPDCPGRCPKLSTNQPSVIADTVEELEGWYAFSEERHEVQQHDLLKVVNRTEATTSPQPKPDIDLDEIQKPPMSSMRHNDEHVGRNDPCPCGSGKKFKKCCLRAGN